ncbi:MAG: ABC transporter substrate-binding protein [Thermomicrobiales bacterium]
MNHTTNGPRSNSSLSFDRRRAVKGGIGLALASVSVASGGLSAVGAQATPAASPEASPASVELLDRMTIDLSGEPQSLDPALAESPRDWSVVHAIYDSPLQWGTTGQIEPLAAESFRFVDTTTIEIVLREGLTFHDGSSVTSAAIGRAVTHLQDPDSGSQVTDLFAPITSVKEVDERTAHLITSAPSPGLLVQIATWLVLLPEGFTADSLAKAPVGSGPFAFDSYEAGNQIVLKRNPAYAWGSPKGQPMAEQAVYRFVPEAATRVADLASGSTDIIVEIPIDQEDQLSSGGAKARDVPLVGTSFVRLITDQPPFDNTSVRTAILHAIDVESIAQALISPNAHRLASIYPDQRAMGFDPSLAPHAYDPDLAKSMLNDAGLGDGFDVDFEITTAARQDVAEAISGMLGDVGIRCTIKALEYTEFNQTWKDGSAPLRMVTWSPLYDPSTLLGLVFAKDGYLSRYTNVEANELIAQAATETDVAKRTSLYQQLGRVMHDDPAAIYLWNMTGIYGVSSRAQAWSMRGDEIVLPVTGGTAG